MAEEKMLSVIIPVYNSKEYLSDCLASIEAQTYKNLEIICVDDGSIDDSLAVLRQIASTDARVRVIHQENGGVTSARLRGVQEASGEWIGFVDGDDYIEPEMYQRLLDNAIRYEAQISHCGYQVVFSDRVNYCYNTGRFVQQNSREALKNLLEGSFEPCLCNKLFKRDLFDCVLDDDLMNRSVRINEDLLMNFYLFREAERTVFEDICPYHYMVRKGSASTSTIKPYMLRDPGVVRQILMEETKNDSELYVLCLRSYLAYLTRLSTMSLRDQSDEIADCVYEARKQLKAKLPEMWQMKGFGSRQRFLSSWAAAWPESYRLVHYLYGEITGVNHKYDVN